MKSSALLLSLLLAGASLGATGALAVDTTRLCAIVPARDPVGKVAVPIEMRPRLLFNPDLDSSHFFVPGLVGIIMQLVTLFLTSFAIVRERLLDDPLGGLKQMQRLSQAKSFLSANTSQLTQAIVGGVLFSLLVGGGLMALVFYSSRHGYDDDVHYFDK
jgi:hypothetical protein